MAIRVCVAGATGWAGSLVTRAILESEQFQLVGALARQSAGTDIGSALGQPEVGIKLVYRRVHNHHRQSVRSMLRQRAVDAEAPQRGRFVVVAGPQHQSAIAQRR